MPFKAKEFFEGWNPHAEKMKKQAPAVTQGFGAMFQKIMADGALSAKEKEYVALGIGVASTCTHCIHMHVKKLVEMGATREQIIEAAGVAVVMRGGPAYTHMPAVIDALDVLEAK